MTPILLPCRPASSLDWNPEPVGPVLWEFDLGLSDPFFPLEDELHFQSLALALKTFTQELWPRFQEQTQGAILYRGSADFSRHFLWSERQEANYEEWKTTHPPCSEPHLKRLYCAEAFVTYFQMLAHKLPDELSLSLVFDKELFGTPAETLHLLSKERFEHFHLDLPGKDASAGICFPEDCDAETLIRIDRLIAKLNASFRAVPESMLTESWDGLDLIYVLSDKMSERGKRKLKGFQAAGGLIQEV